MNTKHVFPDLLTSRIPRPLGGRARAMIVLSAAALLLAPGLRAQSEAPRQAAVPAAQPGSTKLYSMKFSGGSVENLEKELKAAFPKDNVVVSGSSKLMSMPNLGEFEVRDVQLKELGRTIEFLSDSRLIVEVTEGQDGKTGNIWRIGSRLANTPPALFKLQMCSVAAPYLFRDKEKAERVRKDAQDAEAGRLKRILETTRAGYNDIVGGARVEMLPDQHLFVIVGSEAGIAGMESFIKAAEQLAMEDAIKKEALAASLVPKMRAVLAPHLFKDEAKLKRVLEECHTAQDLRDHAYGEMMQSVGVNKPLGQVRVQARPDQKVFVLIGSEDGIAGMETLIQAAEKNAAEEDAKLSAAKAVIEDLEQQLRLAEQTLAQEKEVMVARREGLAAAKAEKAKAWEVQLREAPAISPEKRAQLLAEKDADLKNMEKMLTAAESKSVEQMDQLLRLILETRIRLEAAHAKAQK